MKLFNCYLSTFPTKKIFVRSISTNCYNPIKRLYLIYKKIILSFIQYFTFFSSEKISSVEHNLEFIERTETSVTAFYLIRSNILKKFYYVNYKRLSLKQSSIICDYLGFDYLHSLVMHQQNDITTQNITINLKSISDMDII